MTGSERNSIGIPPADFPVEPIFAIVGGAQPKLALCRNEQGNYASPRRSSEEVMSRFEAADNLVRQLVIYFERKKFQFPSWSDEVHLERIRRGIANKVAQGKWLFTEAEQKWIMARLNERCSPASSEGA